MYSSFTQSTNHITLMLFFWSAFRLWSVIRSFARSVGRGHRFQSQIYFLNQDKFGFIYFKSRFILFL